MKRRGEFIYMLYCHPGLFRAYLQSFSNVYQARNTLLKQIIQAHLRLFLDKKSVTILALQTLHRFNIAELIRLLNEWLVC